MNNNPALTLALGKLAAALAWADGVLDIAEQHAVRDIVFSLPTLSERAWQEVEMYLDRPVNEAELDRLIEEITSLISSNEDRDRIVDTLRGIAKCDGVVSPEEEETLERVKAALDTKPLSLGEHVRAIVLSAVGKRKEQTSSEPAREEKIEDYLLNTVFYDVTSKAAEANRTIRLDKDKLRETCLASAIMAVVVDKQSGDPNPGSLISSALASVWGLREDDARFIAFTSLDRVAKGIDTLRTCRSFYEITTSSQREAFMRCLAAIACKDGACSPSVLAHLAEIASFLRVSDDAYRAEINALNVAKDKKSSAK